VWSGQACTTKVNQFLRHNEARWTTYGGWGFAALSINSEDFSSQASRSLLEIEPVDVHVSTRGRGRIGFLCLNCNGLGISFEGTRDGLRLPERRSTVGIVLDKVVCA